MHYAIVPNSTRDLRVGEKERLLSDFELISDLRNQFHKSLTRRKKAARIFHDELQSQGRSLGRLFVSQHQVRLKAKALRKVPRAR